ncbi:hypothetical protein PLICBS_002942 [Purpureocillium lilacinum]|uniref:uncharacterized protein n=1 Tax=Purpureocillium lilacinum TaxID=33203 RepID=UPI002083C816|nr:hypothetical protein PLICBS_002942 [Purpureocillium lilacinum]
MPESGWSRERDRDRDRDPPPSRRQSITERLRGTFSQARKDTAATIQRRASSATRQSPIPRIREWLDTCNGQHHNHCSGDRPSDVPTWRPVYLIDTVERCLVRAKPTDRYTALSYVWGVATRRDGPGGVAQLLSSNADALQLGLADADIPKTILDAIWLSKKLGIRHLWVDRLCITQDDEADKADHIEHMAYVFANAYLTIVAAYGDVDTGLLPLDPRRPTRTAKGGPREHNDLLLSSRWNTRGWTLQELLYSRRAVFFFEDSVTWECHCDLWQGSPTGVLKAMRGKRNECNNRLSSAAFGFQHAPWPDLDEYARVAMDYSSRRVTLVDDTLAAFSGITHVLSRVFAGGFVYGMPLMFLDVALLWRPQATIRRRALTRPPFLPSWSWMGWWFDGIPVDLTLWRAGADYVEETRATKRGQGSKRFQPTHSFRIKPTVTWTLTDRANSVPITNNGLQYRELRSRKSANAQLPPGWVRSGGSHFKHDSDELTVFKYPVPVEEPPEEGDYDPRHRERPLPGPLLAFKTTAAFFDVDYAISMTPKERPNPPIAVGNIWSRSDRWVGEFRAHDGWLGVQSSNYDGDEKLEFIAISTAMERKGSYVFSMERFEENMDSDEIIDIVNVLWIERIAGVAYRRGIGHILQKAWDAQAKDEVDILLG